MSALAGSRAASDRSVRNQPGRSDVAEQFERLGSWATDLSGG